MNLTLSDWGEDRFIAWVRSTWDVQPGQGVVVPNGDDCAILAPAPGKLQAITTDALIEGVHFRRKTFPPALLGRKALAVNLSDLAASGARPLGALLTLALAKETPLDYLKALVEGMAEEARKYGVYLLGGDTCGSPGPLMINVTLIGNVEGPHLLRRNGASAGDVVCITGTVGASALGLEALERGMCGESGVVEEVIRTHREVTPRLLEGRFLASRPEVTACMDLSDGLWTDLGRLTAASDAGAWVDVDQIPLSEVTREAGRLLGIDPVEAAVTGGEDYELLFTVQAGAWTAFQEAWRKAGLVDCTVIGEIVQKASGPEWKRQDGNPYQPERKPFGHFG